MSTDRKHSRELVRQLRAKALQVKKERGLSEGTSGNGGTSRMEGRGNSSSRSVGASSFATRSEKTTR